MNQDIYLQDILQRGKNNFDLIRLIAALAVIFGHSFYLFPTGGYQEPITQLVARNFTGTLAVGTFFFLSGILISQSFNNSSTAARYILMRAARIYPGVLVCMVVTAFLIGPLVSDHGLKEYFTLQNPFCYPLTNWSFIAPLKAWGNCTTLPGVFTTNRIPHDLNGSLWTIGPELVCYAYVLVFGLLGCLISRKRILLALASLLAIHAFYPTAVPFFSDSHYSDVLKVGLFFMAGVAAFGLRHVLRIRPLDSIPLVILAALLQKTAVQEYALYTALFHLVLVAAASPRLRSFQPHGDYSFGVYIYGWPIQQTLNHLQPELTSYPSNLICLPAALLAGYLSWNYVEKPVLDYCHMRSRRTSALTAPPI